MIVVADNCTDDTAQVARDFFRAHALKPFKAEVIERNHRELRGKGYALDFGVRHCKNNPPEVVIIVDADCLLDDGTIAALANSCVTHQKPIQARYLMRGYADSSLKIKVAEFAMRLKNRIRPIGYKQLGLPCQLMGTGMAFLWEDINAIELASGHIVEDLKMGLDLSALAQYPIFHDEHEVYSYFPQASLGFEQQRARWEHGQMSVILQDAKNVFFQAISRLDYRLLALALDLIIPPLALLTMFNIVAMVLNGIFYYFTGLIWSFEIALLSNFLLILSILIAWWYAGRDILSSKQLLFLPLYLLQKIPLYIQFLFNRQVTWVRTKRDK